jgi:hypothetical protein
LPLYWRNLLPCGERLADVALVWRSSQAVVAAPIIGPRPLEQFTGSLHALDIKLTPDHLKRDQTKRLAWLACWCLSTGRHRRVLSEWTAIVLD